MKIDKQLLTPNKYSRPQTPLKQVKKVVVHYVGNAGSTAQNNRDYFNNAPNHKTYVSSHYVVGLKGEIIQCIPESEIAYCSNQANGYSISIETCHPKADGVFNKVTEDSLIELVADICKRHKLDPMVDVIRHYDVTGKRCPLDYVNNPKKWERFIDEVSNLVIDGLAVGDEVEPNWKWYVQAVEGESVYIASKTGKCKVKCQAKNVKRVEG